MTQWKLVIHLQKCFIITGDTIALIIHWMILKMPCLSLQKIISITPAVITHNLEETQSFFLMIFIKNQVDSLRNKHEIHGMRIQISPLIKFLGTCVVPEMQNWCGISDRT
ncbi:hypothetical protein VP01_1625g9 [Puccinia sorghi]|uniref:Uncharacterized protein n=1 Tax=Puccinia sorghi TaxID=27349 RepID=A0A0L6VIS7_9BASI|nr:hypothetical protein VP01_1625g9 [Puccinia sorghi]